ncbi:hypothetical protein [Bdellovibrio sp.]|uniref:hypothetical protein n=1 Tax=Bdellovibrio sp. TaxID=28201 RepID=UPI0039E57B81
MMLRTKLLALSLVSGLSFIATSPAQAGWEALQPANVWERIQKQVAKQQIGASVNLVSAEVLDGISTSLRYRIQSEPSYMDGFYTRIDKYVLNFGLSPGDFIEDLDTPVGMRMDKNSEIIFARQFKSQSSSLLALPYTPRNLPFTAQRAIERLEPGDFVAFQGRLSFVISLGHDALKGSFHAGASTHALISGDFMVHVFRMADNKVRVKLIAIRGKGMGAGAGIDLSQDLEIFGISLIDDRIERWLSFTPLDVAAGIHKYDVVMLDYVFNLDNPQAAQAYDNLMINKVQLKDIKIINPTLSQKDLTKELLTDLTDVEDIAREDALQQAQQRRIDRIFKGSSEGVTRDSRIKFGLNLWKFEAGRAFGENKVLSYDKYDREQYFLLDTFSKFKKTKILFGLFGEETLLTSNLLFTADTQWNPSRFVTLTTSHEMRMRDVSAKDFQEAQRLVRETIGDTDYNKIDWKEWNFSNGKVVNGYFKQEVFFNPDALRALPYLSEANIAAGFAKYVHEKGRPRSRPFIGGNSPKDYIFSWVAAFTGDVRRVANRLSIIINPKKTTQERFEAFQDLQEIPIWRERGIGFLMSYLPEDSRADLLRYEMVLSAKGMPTVKHSFGFFAEEKLYRSLMYIQNVINNRSFDLRLYTDAEGEFRSTATPSPLQ